MLLCELLDELTKIHAYSDPKTGDLGLDSKPSTRLLDLD